MADGFVRVPPDSTGKLVDADFVTIAGRSVARQRIVVASGPTGDHSYGTSPAVVQLATQTLVTIIASDFRLRGFCGNGDADGFFSLQLDGSEIASGKINGCSPNLDVNFPSYLNVSGTLTLKVTNVGDGTARFAGLVFGDYYV